MSKILKYVAIIAILPIILTAFFTVSIQAATITTTKSAGYVGDLVTVQISGAATSDVINIYFDSTDRPLADDLSGQINYSRNVTIPSAKFGNHYIVIDINGTQTTKSFTVQPSISLSSVSAQPGTSITATGNGFGPTKTVTLYLNSMVGSVVSSALGYWTTSFVVPVSISSGAYSFIATDADSNTVSTPFTVLVVPKITVNPTSGPAGTSVTITGSGFSAGESGITATLNGTAVGTSTSADSNGAWSVRFNTQVMAGGTYTLDAYGNTTLASAVNNLNFLVTPTVSASPSSGSPGSVVTVLGSGFTANESVTIIYDSSDIQSGIQADASGSWSKTITIPPGISGLHKIYARGTSTVKSPPAGLDFKIGAAVSINKVSGAVGTVVSVTGSGFAAKESGLNIDFDGIKTAITATAGDTGGWTASFTIPATFGGDHQIGAEGKTTTAASVASVTFTVEPSLTPPDKTQISIGDSISLNGSGFASGEPGIYITYDSKILGQKFSADTKGAWKATVTIPPSAAGQHVLQVIGTATSTQSIAPLSVEVLASMTISPSAGFVGSFVSVSGSGFDSNSNLRFTFDNSELNVGLVTTDRYGNFNKSITVPKATGGDHVIQVQDSQNNSMQAVFNMDSEAPPMPKIISPASGEQIGMFGNITPTLEWSKVTDPSGVTYNLQLAGEETFDSPIIDVSGITATKYSVKKDEPLARGQYFWRVQAVDGASNAGSWTNPATLVSGKISPVIFTLIVVGIVVLLGVGVFFLLIWFRRKRQAHKDQVAPEIVIPEIVNAEYKQIESGDKKSLPWRLALPQAPQPARGAKSNISSEDQARLKVIIDFAKSVPLAEPGANTNWLVDLAENTTGLCASPALYSQLVRGELQLRYEPAWMRHPTYIDLQTLLEGQSLLEDLNTFVDTVNRTASEGEAALGDIYQEIVAEIRWDIFPNGGWVYISAIYIDSFNWFQGKYLKEPSERDYSIKAEPLAAGGDGFGLYAESNTPFAGLLIQTGEEKDARDLRTLHLKLRRDFRNSERIKLVVTSIIQLEVQRNRLMNAFRQFNRLTPS